MVPSWAVSNTVVVHFNSFTDQWIEWVPWMTQSTSLFQIGGVIETSAVLWAIFMGLDSIVDGIWCQWICQQHPEGLRTSGREQEKERKKTRSFHLEEVLCLSNWIAVCQTMIILDPEPKTHGFAVVSLIGYKDVSTGCYKDNIVFCQTMNLDQEQIGRAKEFKGQHKGLGGHHGSHPQLTWQCLMPWASFRLAFRHQNHFMTLRSPPTGSSDLITETWISEHSLTQPAMCRFFNWIEWGTRKKRWIRMPTVLCGSWTSTCEWGWCPRFTEEAAHRGKCYGTLWRLLELPQQLKRVREYKS